MKLWQLVILFTLSLNVCLAEVVVRVNLRYAKLVLKDGREFTDVVLKSYDLVADRVTVHAGNSLLSWPVVTLPDDVRVSLEKLAPKVSAEELERERKSLLAEKAAVEKRAKAALVDKQKHEIKEAREIKKDSRKLAIKQAEIATRRVEQLPSDAAQTAEAYVKRYFDSASEPGMPGMISLSVDVDLSDPEPVSGWGGRWRITGKAFMKYYHSQGAVSSRVRAFEILVQTKERGKPEVVDFTLL